MLFCYIISREYFSVNIYIERNIHLLKGILKIKIINNIPEMNTSMLHQLTSFHQHYQILHNSLAQKIM